MGGEVPLNFPTRSVNHDNQIDNYSIVVSKSR